MGAEHTLDLTSDVTHLLVGDTDSKKYQYVAKEREDVKVLKPEWVQAVREIWMADHPLDLNALDAQYRVPTLFGLKICITGFEDLAFRNGLAQDIQKNGGIYTGDLTKDATHLIAAAPAGKKFEYATLWQVKVVSVKWYKDTLDRGMQLDESLYHPAMQPEQQGIGAWNRQGPISPKLGKRAKQDQPVVEPSRKLRRTASTRFNSQHENMWNDIVGNNDPTRDVTESGEEVFQPAKPTFTTRTEQVGTGDTPRAPLRVPKTGNRTAGILDGKHFSTKGFDGQRRTLLYNALAGLGAVVHDSVSQMSEQPGLDPQNQFLVVPYTTDPNILTLLAQRCPNVALVTELWVEWCITVKQYVVPEQYVLGRPVSPAMLPAVSKLVVNATGFHQVQTMHIAKIVSRLGARYQETFTPQTTVLVCNSANVNPQKLVRAQSWRVPIVTEKWLEQFARNGRLPSFEPFKVGQHQKTDIDPAISIHDRSVQQPNEPVTAERQAEAFNAPNDGITSCNAPDGAIQTKQTPSASIPDSHRAFDAETNNSPEDSTNDGNNQQAEEVGKNAVQDVLREKPSKTGPLQEISANIPAKKQSPIKKKLFRAFDGHSSILDDTLPFEQEDLDEPEVVTGGNENESAVSIVDSRLGAESQPEMLSEKEKQNELLKEFFEVKAAAAAKAAEVNQQRPRQSRTKKLLGRALSNLSNSSRTSNETGNKNSKDAITSAKQPLSRASSINSVNTDGLGVPLSAISRLPTEGSNGCMPAPGANHTIKCQALKGNPDRNGQDMAPSPLIEPTKPSNHDTTFTTFQAQLLAFTTSQPTRAASPPSRSQDLGQLTYADTAEAMKLKAQLAEKRRARAKLGQQLDDPTPELSKEESEERRQREWREMERLANERGVLRDDEALVGGGRRTRGRDKALAGLEGGRDGEGGWGAGLPI